MTISKKRFRNIFDGGKAPQEKATVPAVDPKNEIQIKFRINAEAKKQLDWLAVEKEATKQDLLVEALNNLFMAENKPPIA